MRSTNAQEQLHAHNKQDRFSGAEQQGRVGEVSERGNHSSDYQVGEVVRWRWNKEVGVIAKVSEITNTIEVIFDSGKEQLLWCDQIEKV